MINFYMSAASYLSPDTTSTQPGGGNWIEATSFVKGGTEAFISDMKNGKIRSLQ
jgi:hypothetical protein